MRINRSRNIRFGFLGFFFLVFCIGIFPGTVRAQSTGSALAEIDLAVPPLQRLEVEPGLLGIPTPTSGDFSRGRLDLPDPVFVEVWSNVPWTLSLRAAEEGAAVPLYYRVDGSRYLPLDGEWRIVARGEGTADRERVRLELRLLLSWTEALPGLYEPRVEYRLDPAGEEKR